MKFKDLFNELYGKYQGKKLEKYDFNEYEKNYFNELSFETKKEYFSKQIATKLVEKFGSFEKISQAFTESGLPIEDLNDLEVSYKNNLLNAIMKLEEVINKKDASENPINTDNLNIADIENLIKRYPDSKEKDDIVNGYLSLSFVSKIRFLGEDIEKRNIVLDLVDKNIPIEEQELMVEDTITNGDKSLYTFKIEKEYDEELTELKNSVTDEKSKETIDFINDHVLATGEEKSVNNYLKISESSAKEYKNEEVKRIINDVNKEEVLKKNLYENDFHIVSSTDEYKKGSPKEMRDYIKNNDVKIKFSDKTKEILKEGLEYLNELKDIDGNALLDLNTYATEEGANKVYAFKNIMESRRKAEDIINSDSKNKVEELKKVEDFYKKSNSEYDHLIDIVKKFDHPGYPANISVSRNKNMPEKYIKDYKNVSLVNGLWHTLALIKKTGSTIDEYLNDPLSIENKYNSQFKDYGDLKEACKNTDEIDVINAFMGHGRGSDVDKAINGVIRKADTLRFLEFSGMIDKENISNNQKTYGIFYATVVPDFSRLYLELKGKFNNKETLKNILMCDSKELNYASLIDKEKNVYDPLTGEKINNFDYESELKKDNLDVKTISDRISNIVEKIDDKKYNNIYDDLADAIKDVSLDILKNRTIEEIPNLDDFMSNADLTCTSYLKMKRGNLSSVDYAKNILSNSNSNDSISNLKETLLAYKGINDKYNNRNFFSKHLLRDGIKEGKALKEFKEYFKSFGVDEAEMKDFLDGKKGIDEMTSDAIISEKKAVFTTEGPLDLENEINTDMEKSPVVTSKELVTETVKNKEEVLE